MLVPFTNTYKQIRKSFIENKIFKMNEQINQFSKQVTIPCKEVDDLVKKKRDLIDKFNKLDN